MAHRLRRWASIKTTLGERVVLSVSPLIPTDPTKTQEIDPVVF